MRKLILSALIAGVVFGGGYAIAQIVSALPFQLQNNTVADATQVMANFNQLLNGVNANAAKNGANSDITALLGLSTPLAPSVGGTLIWNGGTSGGSANAQTVTTVPAVYASDTGRHIVFKAGFANTGAMVLNVNGTGNAVILRQTQLGAGAMVGGEISAGDMVDVVWDGAQYQLLGKEYHVGAVADTIETTAPAGWAIADGSCISAITYAALYSIASSTWGSCSAGQFALPDYQGRVGVAKDGASRISTACSGSNTLGTGCGAQNHSLVMGELPASPPAGTVSAPTITIVNGAGVVTVGGGGGPIYTGGANGGASTVTATSSTPTFTGSNLGSGTAFSVVQPTLIVNKIVKL